MSIDIRITSRLADLARSLAERANEISAKEASELASKWQARVPVRTGAYRDSIHAEKVGEHKWRVSTSLPYPEHLEFGTRNMAPHPSLGPVSQAEVPNFIGAMSKVADDL